MSFSRGRLMVDLVKKAINGKEQDYNDLVPAIHIEVSIFIFNV